MRVLAVDIGTTAGVATLDTRTGALWSQTWQLARTPKTTWGRRLEVWEQLLYSLTRPEALVYERVRRHSSTQAAHAYGALRGVLLLWAHKRHLRVETVEVAEWKKAAGLKGNADKGTVAAELSRRWPGERLGQDEGEARLMALCFADRETTNA